MDTLRREYLPFCCPACGSSGNSTWRQMGTTLAQRLFPVYICDRCKERLRPHRYWLTVFLVCFMVSPAATVGGLFVAGWLRLGATVSISLAALMGLAAAVIAFQLLARILVAWRRAGEG